MKKALIALVSCLAVTSCKKETDRVASVQVTDTVSGNSMQGVSVDLDGVEVSSQVVTTTFVDVASSTSDGSGVADLTFENKRYASFRLRCSQEDYFTHEEEINPDVLYAVEEKQVELMPAGYIQYKLKNVAPANSADMYRLLIYSNPYNTHCPTNCDLLFEGANVDTTITHQVPALDYTVFERINVSGGSSARDSAYIPQGDTAVVLINY